MSLMLRLILLVLIAVLPAIAIQAYNEFDLRRARQAEIRAQVIEETKQQAAEMGQLREGARQLLLALAELPAVRMRDAAACNTLLASLKQQYPSYSALAAADAEGRVFCASSQAPHGSDVAAQPFFTRAIASDDVAMGSYRIDPATGRGSVQFALAFHDQAGGAGGVVYASLDLAWLARHLVERGIAPGASILIADGDGTIIARVPDPGGLIGESIGAAHLGLLKDEAPGTEESVGLDGVDRIFAYYSPTLPPRDIFVSYGVSKSLAFADIDRATERGIVLILVGFALAAYAAWLGGRMFVRQPIAGLLAAVGEWRRSNYAARAPVKDRGSEIGHLGSAFNEMVDALARREAEQRAAQRELEEQQDRIRRLNATLEERVEQRTRELADANRLLTEEIKERERAQTALIHAQKMEAVGRLTSGIAHDFNNLLAAILGNLEMARMRAEDQSMIKLLDAATRASERGAKLIGELLVFSRRQHLQLRPLALETLIGEMEELLSRALGSLIRLETAFEPDLWLAQADAGQLELAILNLAINARDAMPGGGTLAIGIANIPTGDPRLPEELEGDFAMISVRDTGAGMSADVLARVFEPFFTTKEPGKGSGLGLSIVYGMARQSGGTVRIASTPGAGTTVSLFLPRAAASERAGASDEAGTEAARAHLNAGAGVRLLLADDDREVREFTAEALRGAGYEVIEAADGREALVALDAAGRLDLLVVDFAMPHANGIEVARRARRLFADLPVLIITAFAEAPLDDLPKGFAVLWKPFRLADLTDQVALLLESSSVETSRRVAQKR